MRSPSVVLVSRSSEKLASVKEELQAKHPSVEVQQGEGRAHACDRRPACMQSGPSVAI